MRNRFPQRVGAVPVRVTWAVLAAVMATILTGTDVGGARYVDGAYTDGAQTGRPVQIDRSVWTDTTDSTDADPGARAAGPASPIREADTTTTQRPWHEEAWNRIAVIDGVAFSYLYYSKADEINDGVVIRLENTLSRAVTVSFTVVFRTPQDEATAVYNGHLAPGEMKTGGNDGLYWVPFTSGASIGEVGLRGVSVE